MKTTLLLLLLITLGAACREVKPDCGCGSTSYQVHKGVVAIYSKGSITGLNANIPFGGYYTVCNPDFVRGKVADADTVVLDGNTSSNCYKGESLGVLPGHIQLTAIRKK